MSANFPTGCRDCDAITSGRCWKHAQFTTTTAAEGPTVATVCPRCGYPSCTCGSGAHPRRCTLHPDTFAVHVEMLNREAAIDDLLDDCMSALSWAGSSPEAPDLIERIRALREPRVPMEATR